MFYIKAVVLKAKEGLAGSIIVHTNGLEELSNMTQDALANTGNLTFGKSL